ncbi:MAG: hypothetical protein JST00_08325 [Deltaproteobacteria bacterium]|nr:hypothetical protein [Deltaproteobacteria bacterium]
MEREGDEHGHGHGHGHGHACDCHAHRAASAPPSSSEGLWANVIPVLACAVCPACMSAYAKIFSALGAGATLSARTHGLLVGLALVVSLVMSARRAHRTRTYRMFCGTAFFATLVLVGHVREASIAEWIGIAGLLAVGLYEHPAIERLRRRLRSSAHPAPPSV